MMRVNVFRLQAWQLFVVLFAIPLVNQLVLSDRVGPPPDIAAYRADPTIMADYAGAIQPYLFAIVGFPLLVLLCQLFYLGQVARTLARLQPPEVPALQRWLRFHLPYIGVLLVAFFYVVYQLYSHPAWFRLQPGDAVPDDLAGFSGTVLLLTPFLMYLVVAYLLLLLYIARALRSIELGSKAPFRAFALDWLLLMLLPLGVWLLQPRFRRVHDAAVEAGRLEG
jgi:hypothetical protein